MRIGLLLITLAGLTVTQQPNRGSGSLGPIVQIVEPAPGFRLYPGRMQAIRIRVHPRDAPVAQWTLTLRQPPLSVRVLAHGNGGVDTAAIARLRAEDVRAGEPVMLSLAAEDAGGATASAEATFVVADPLYTLIPLEEGNLSRTRFPGLSVNAAGDLVAIGAYPYGDIEIRDRQNGSVRRIQVPLGSTEGQKLSGDGRHFLFARTNRIGIFDLGIDALHDGPLGEDLFSGDHTGRRIAFQSNYDLDPSVGNPDRSLQYFLYDDETKSVRQLTNDPNAIIYDPVYPFCPGIVGTTPMISGDGSTVVFMTSTTLGLVPPDPGMGCHVFAYNVPSDTLRHVAAVPKGVVLNVPSLSYDGRWLGMTSTRPAAFTSRGGFPALLDIQTAELTDPVGGVDAWVGYDSVISSDGATIVVSNQADLDPRVGNADHNMELFAYDRTQSTFLQISSTTGGIGRTPGSCAPYRPGVSADAGVVTFTFKVLSVENCHLDGPQRNEADGFRFRFVRAVRKRPGNRGPIFAPATQVRVLAGETMHLPFTASDPDNDPITFFAQVIDGLDVPPGSVITDHHNGTATFTWPTTPAHAGVTMMRVAAFDEGGGEVFHDLTLAVCNRILNDADEAGVITAIFSPDPPPPCHDADLNHDGLLSAADLVAERIG